MYLLIALLIASHGSLTTDWWASASPQRARAHWQEVAAGQPQKARAELVALLEARDADPAGRAALVWDVLRSGPEFRTSLAAVLANPASDGLVALLADRSAGAVALLHALAACRENASVEARTAALEALGRVGGRRERELLLTVLL
ncbi:MAG: hypothetical protein GY856_25530, partial [bacterium]|nr:hypothetical protein [bacterium]